MGLLGPEEARWGENTGQRAQSWASSPPCCWLDPSPLWASASSGLNSGCWGVGGGPAAPPVGGSGPCFTLVFFSAKQMSYFFSVFQPVFLPHPSPKCFLVLIYLAKKVCGERHRTGHGCHSRCLQLLCVFLRLSPEQLTFSVSLGLDLSGKGREKETHF